MNKKMLKKMIANDSQNLLKHKKENWFLYQLKKIFYKIINN